MAARNRFLGSCPLRAAAIVRLLAVDAAAYQRFLDIFTDKREGRIVTENPMRLGVNDRNEKSRPKWMKSQCADPEGFTTGTP